MENKCFEKVAKIRYFGMALKWSQRAWRN